MNKSHGGGGGGGGSCGGGGGGSRKASNRIWDDGDDFCVFTEPKRPSRPCDSNKSKGETRPKWKPKAKVPLQTLHMTSENQEKVKALLRDLQEQEEAPLGRRKTASPSVARSRAGQLDKSLSFFLTAVLGNI